MVFNVTKLDKIRLLQTLYIHADPKGYGNMEYAFNDVIGKNVEGLTEEECASLLKMDTPELNGYLVDYYNGKPIKFDFEHRPNGDVWVSSIAYDISNGRYRFLEALLYVFNLDEIIITNMDYPPQLDALLDDHTKRAFEETLLIENILEQTILYSDNGMYWKLDPNTVDYKPPFMRGI
jgi:hypothetical protein